MPAAAMSAAAFTPSAPISTTAAIAPLIRPLIVVAAIVVIAIVVVVVVIPVIIFIVDIYTPIPTRTCPLRIFCVLRVIVVFGVVGLLLWCLTKVRLADIVARDS